MYVVLPSPLTGPVVRAVAVPVAAARSFVTRTVVVDTAVCAEAAEHERQRNREVTPSSFVSLGVGCDGRWCPAQVAGCMWGSRQASALLACAN